MFLVRLQKGISKQNEIVCTWCKHRTREDLSVDISKSDVLGFKEGHLHFLQSFQE